MKPDSLVDSMMKNGNHIVDVINKQVLRKFNKVLFTPEKQFAVWMGRDVLMSELYIIHVYYRIANKFLYNCNWLQSSSELVYIPLNAFLYFMKTSKVNL